MDLTTIFPAGRAFSLLAIAASLREARAIRVNRPYLFGLREALSAAR